MTEDILMFGDHYVGDQCNATLPDQVKRAARAYFLRDRHPLWAPFFLPAAVLDLAKLIANYRDARSRLNDYTLRGYKDLNPPTFKYPDVVDLSQYPLGTIVRSSQEQHRLSSESLIDVYRNMKEPRSIYSAVELSGDGRYLQNIATRLGLICQFGSNEKRLLSFNVSPAELVDFPVLDYDNVPAGFYDFKTWSHQKTMGSRGSTGMEKFFEYDIFSCNTSLEILGIPGLGEQSSIKQLASS